MASKQRELDPATHKAVKAHCSKGDELAATHAFKEAIVEYNKAWALVPDPKEEWETSTWILATIGDAAFLGGYNALARDALGDAMICPGAIGNPFLHLRYGQALLDAGEADAAANELIRAYMAEGEKIFASEHPRYLEFLKTRAKL